MSEDEDCVIATFDVFCSPSLAGCLHLFQFPLRNSARPYETSGAKMFVTSGCNAGSPPVAPTQGQQTPVVTKSSRVTLHCEVDTFAVAQSFDQQSRVVKTEYEDISQMHKYHFSLQSEPFTQRNDYAVAVFRENELHLTPLTTIQQFLPVVRSDPTQRSTEGASRVEDIHCSKKPDEGMVGGPIADIISRQMKRQRSFAINTDAKSERAVDYFQLKSVESQTVAKRLFSSTLSQAPLPQPLRKNATAMDALFPPETIVDHGANAPKDIVLQYASDYSVAAQIKDLMHSCQAITIDQLRTFLRRPRTSADAPISDATILEGLRACALFMHNVWVCKTNAKFRGNAAALREVILLKFFQSDDGTLRRDDINKLLLTRHSGLLSNIKEILQSVSDLEGDEVPLSRRWRLRGVAKDKAVVQQCVMEFERRHPQDAQFQSNAWAKRTHAILTHLLTINAGKIVRTLYLPTSVSGDPNMMPPSKAVAGAPVAASSPAGTLPQATDPTVLKIRSFTRKLFVEHGVINKQRAKEMIAKARDEHFAGATNQMMSVAVQEEVRQFTQATWVLKSLQDAELDYYRPYLHISAIELDSFESKVLVAAATKKLEEAHEGGLVSGERPFAPPTNVLNRVLQEIAVFKGGERLWHIKSGNVL